MKTLLELFFLLFVSLVLFSCQKEDDEIGIMCEAASSGLMQTKSAKAAFSGDRFLEQLKAIPVHIYYEEGAVAATKRFLSCSSRDGYEIVASDKDDDSGRQRWLISKHIVGGQYEWSIEVLGGYPGGRKYLSDYPLPPNAGIAPFPCMHNQLIFTHGYWQLKCKDRRWYIYRYGTPDEKYICNTSWGGSNFKYLIGDPYNNLGAGFLIYPVETFNLDVVDYSTISGQTNATPETVFLTSRPLINDTPYEAERVAQLTEDYSYTSKFSQTEGLLISETISVGAGLNVTVPVINVGLSGKIETSKRTDHSYSFTTGKDESFKFTFTQTVKQVLPPNTTVIAWLEAKKYVFNTRYAGSFTGEKSGKVIKLNGNWAGTQYYEVGIRLTKPDGQILGTIDSKGVYQTAKSVEYIDIQKANSMIREYNLEKASNSSI